LSKPARPSCSALGECPLMALSGQFFRQVAAVPQQRGSSCAGPIGPTRAPMRGVATGENAFPTKAPVRGPRRASSWIEKPGRAGQAEFPSASTFLSLQPPAPIQPAIGSGVPLLKPGGLFSSGYRHHQCWTGKVSLARGQSKSTTIPRGLYALASRVSFLGYRTLDFIVSRGLLVASASARLLFSSDMVS
jgi:hypothetical protein